MPNFDCSPLTHDSETVPFRALANRLLPGASGGDVARLLDNAAQRTTVCQWLAGRAGAPQWAIDRLVELLRHRHAEDLAAVARTKAGPGLKAGARNLAVWKVEQAKKRNETPT
jgi:hypothetical protein